MLRFRTGFFTVAFLVWTTASGCSDEGSAPATQPSSPSSTSDTSLPSTAAPTADSRPSGPSDPSDPSIPSAPAPPADTRTPEELVAAGRSTFNANCIACHAINPRTDGPLGPAVAGSSLELLEARVILGEYPEGYAPKRNTRVMVPMPHLKAKLPELAAYLDSLE